jgi:hypothetical protein
MDLIKDILNYIKIHWVITIIIFAVLIIIPLGIHTAFYFLAALPFFSAVWSAGDALSFYGSILTAMGSIFLGLAALYQTKKLHYEVLQRENDREIYRLSQIKPHIECTNIMVEEAGKSFDDEKWQSFKYIVHLKNNSPNKIGDAYFEDVKLYNISDCMELTLNLHGDIGDREFDYESENAHTIKRGNGRLVAKYIYMDSEQHSYCLTFEAKCKQDSFHVWVIRQISDEPYNNSSDHIEKTE